MAKIEMDVTEYDALRKNIALLEESKKENKTLYEKIDKLNEEKLQVMKDVQMKVLKSTTITTVQQSIPVETSYEFGNFVRNLTQAIQQRIHVHPSHRDMQRIHKIERGGRITWHDDELRRHNLRMQSQSMNHSMGGSIEEYVAHELRRFINTPIQTTSTVESEPTYVGLSEIRDEIRAKIIAKFDEKTKALLALEPQFTAFQKEKTTIEGMMNTLLKEKLEALGKVDELEERVDGLIKENNRCQKSIDKFCDIVYDIKVLADSTWVRIFNHYFAKKIRSTINNYKSQSKND